MVAGFSLAEIPPELDPETRIRMHAVLGVGEVQGHDRRSGDVVQGRGGSR